MKWLGRAVLVLVALPVIYLSAAFVGAVLPSTGATSDPAIRTKEVRLIRGPIHYDFLLPATDQTRAMFGFARSAGVPIDHPGVEWILVGWGAREFYTTVGGYTDVSAHAIWRGLIGDQAVLRVDVLGPLARDTEGLLVLSLSELEYLGLLKSLSTEMIGKPALDHPGFTQTDAFFPAAGPFNIFRTCNVWVAERLAKAGITVGRWTPIPATLTFSLRWFGRA